MAAHTALYPAEIQDASDSPEGAFSRKYFWASILRDLLNHLVLARSYNS
jgi:hypothetical protein